MTASKDFNNWSYERHKEHETQMAEDANLPFCYKDPDSIDTWRHTKMHQMCQPLIAHYPDAKWMTIGDGRFGSDAHFFQNQGLDVLATSLTDESLQKAMKKGYIDKCAAVNAELIDLCDGEMDFVYCKEAYHHFPKPPVAFYEMFRVAAKGLVLIEPYEQHSRPLGFVKAIAKRKLWNQPLHFEPSGNFIYRTDPKAIAKKLSASGNEGAVAYKLFNDFFHRDLARKKAAPGSHGFLLQRIILGIMNFICRLKLMDYALICLIALKEKPSGTLARELTKNGFRIIDLPKNPYR